MFDWNRAMEGLAGNQTYRGADHFLLQALPERYREEFGAFLEVTMTAAAVGGLGASLIASGVGIPAVAAGLVGLMAAGAIEDLGNEDSSLGNILGFAVDDGEKLINAYGLDAAAEASLREFTRAIVQGIPPPVISP